MAGGVLYRRWRSQTFAEVVGQEHVTRTLLNALALGRVAHAYLFCGPRGTGKTSSGRILAKALHCLTNEGRGEPCNACTSCQAITEGRAIDLIEIDAASNNSVDDIRDLREKVNYAPNEARYKVYIIDEVHMLSTPAFNALLKTLEEPPPFSIFVLCTTEPHRIPATVISRCQRFDFQRIPLGPMVERLNTICLQEGIHIEPAALQRVAKAATGSLRDAENILDQLVAYYGSELGLPQVKALLGLVEDARIKELVRLLLQGDLGGSLALVNRAADDGLDLRRFHRELLEYLRSLLLVKAGSAEALDLSAAELEEMQGLVGPCSLAELVQAVKRLSEVDWQQDGAFPLPLELALVESLRPEARPVPSFVPAPTQSPPGEPRSLQTAAPSFSPPPTGAPGDRSTWVAPGSGLSLAGELAEPDQGSALVAQLRAEWPRVLEELHSTNKMIEALLRSSCEPVAVAGNIITLGFYYAFHREKVEEAQNRRVVVQVLSQILGKEYQVRCIHTPRERRARGGSSGSPPRSEEGTGPGEGGHLVRAALEHYGARIVPS